MSKQALLDMVPESRRKAIYHEQDGKTYVEVRQEVSHIIEAAKMVSEQTPGKDFRHVAYIPDAVINQAFVEGWFHDKVKWKQWANNPANRDFRTWQGKI